MPVHLPRNFRLYSEIFRRRGRKTAVIRAPPLSGETSDAGHRAMCWFRTGAPARPARAAGV